MHQHEPKRFTYKNKHIGWSIGLGLKPRVGHLKKFSNGIQIDSTQFYEDFLAAIDFYIDDLNNDLLNRQLLVNFNNAIKEMRKPLYKTQVFRNYRYLNNKDFEFLKE